MTLKRTVISGALLSTMLGAAAPAAADDGPGVEMLTRFSQLPRIYEANPSNPVPVRLKGVVTYVFPDVCDGFVIADEQHYDRSGLVVRPCDAGKQLSGALELEVGETVVVSGETVYENRTVGLSAVNVLRAGRMELSEPPPLKLSDFRRGLRHLRRNRVEGVVAGCVDQPRADGGADSVLWLRVSGSRDPVSVLVRGGLKGAAARTGTLVDATGLSYTNYSDDGTPVSSHLDAMAASVRIIVENYSFDWRIAMTAVGFLLAVAAIAFCFVWLRARRERRIMSLLDADRRRIADDLHDNMQQLLAGAGFRLSAAINVAGDRDAVLLQLAHAQKALEHSKAGLRSVLWGLQDVKESPDSLLGLFRYAASKMPHWEGVVSIHGEGDEPPGVRRMGARLLMILQEAVGNALVHGAARHVDVSLMFSRAGLVMTVCDDGCGFDASRPADAGHLGLASMQRRASELGGVFSLTSEPGKGTEIRIEVK